MSHGKLLGFISTYADDGLCKAYLKAHLLKLCEAYCLNITPKSKKKDLAKQIMVAVKNNSEMVNIAPVDNRRYEVTENFDTSGHIRLRFRLI